MLMSKILAISWLIISPAAFADGVDINLNNTAFQFQSSLSASDFIEGNSELHAGLLYNDLNNIFVDAGLTVKGGGEEEGASGPITAAGVKAVFGSIHRVASTAIDTGSAIAVGGEFGYAFPTAAPVALVVEYFFSTKILTFADAERFNQFGLRLELMGSPQAKVYLGYREIGFGLRSGGSTTLDSGTVLGVNAKF